MLCIATSIELHLEKKTYHNFLLLTLNNSQIQTGKEKKNSLYTGVILLEHSESFLFEKKPFKK